MWPLWVLVLSFLVTLLIVAGNGLVIYLISAKKNLRTTTNWFVLSLALADFGVGAVYSPRLIFCQLSQSCDQQPALLISFFVGLFFGYASVTNLCALTLDRYLAIVKPMEYALFMTKKRMVFLMVGAWAIALLLLLPASVANLMTTYSKFIWTGMAVFFFFLSVTLSFVTARIFVVVRKITRQNAQVVAQLSFNHALHHKVATSHRRESTSAKMIGTVVAIFVVCYMTDVVDTIMMIWSSPLPRPAFFIILTFQRLINSAVNPVAYAFFKKEIKKEMKRLLCRRFSGCVELRRQL